MTLDPIALLCLSAVMLVLAIAFAARKVRNG